MTDQTIDQQPTEPDNPEQPSVSSENAADQDKNKKNRLPKGSVPPSLNLEEAIEIARKIHEFPDGQAPYSAAPDITNNSAKSSVFGKKLMALRDFGVASFDDKKEIVSLTDLGQMVVAPRDEDEHLKALVRSFLSIDLFTKLYEKIKGRPLPQDTYLINTIKDYVPRELADAWLERLKKSLKTAHLLDESRPDGKVYVLDKPQLTQAAKPSDEVPIVKNEKQPLPEEPIRQTEPTRPRPGLPILLGKDKLAYLELPPNWNPRDLKKLLKMVELALSEDEEASE